MTSKDGGPTHPSFWRCPACGTPNPRAAYLTACLGCGASPNAPVFTSRSDQPVEAPRRPSRRLAIVVGAYGLVVLAACLLVRGIGDDWWPGLLLLLAPRWIAFVPLLPMAVLAVRARRARVGLMIATIAVLIAWPLMGFNIPSWAKRPDNPGPTIRVMSFNRGLSPVDVPRFIAYLDRRAIDVVCFQEAHGDPPLDAALDEAGWRRTANRSIATRHTIVAETPRLPERNLSGERYTMTLNRATIRGPGGREFVAASAHLPTLRMGTDRLLRGDFAGFRDHVDWWHAEFDRMSEAIGAEGGPPIVVGGDFNMPIDSTALSRFVERAGFHSAFEEAGLGWGYTRPAVAPWVRIDHILAGPGWTVRRCWIGPGFGSDHRSVVAEVSLPPSQP